MNALSILPGSLGILPINLTFAQCISSAITKICQFAVRQFSFLSNLCLIGYGIKELALDYPSMLSKTNSETISQRILQKIHAQNTTHTVVQGSLYLSSGIFGGIASTQDFHSFNLETALPVLQGVGSGLFLFANFYSLERHIKLFSYAQKLKEDSSYHLLSIQLKTSTILGIISNIGYIISTLASFFPPLQLIALILGLFSIFIGSLKIIFDFFVLNSKLS